MPIKHVFLVKYAHFCFCQFLPAETCRFKPVSPGRFKPVRQKSNNPACTRPAHDDQAVVLAHSPDTGGVSPLCEIERQRDPASLLHTPLYAAPPWWVSSSTQRVACLDMVISLIREWGQLTRGVLPWDKYLSRLPCTIPSSDQDGLWNEKVCTFLNLSALT